MAGDYHTCGTKVPKGKRVRELTGDHLGGTTLPQVDDALRRGWGIDLDTRIGSARLTWEQFVRHIEGGKGAILQGSYVAIHNTKYEGDTRFQGNHAIFIPPNWGAMDPLCDGRRPGIYKYHGEIYPKDLIKRFAGLLLLDPKKNRRLGIGLVWCSLTRDNQENYLVEIRPETAGTRARFYRYFINSNKRITKREVDTTAGFSAKSSPPRLYLADSTKNLPFKNKSLVRLINGSRSGWYVESRWAHEI